MTDIILPISLGEALDKLTILDIKLDKIIDERKINIEYEYDILYNYLNKYICKNLLLYKSLKKINQYIWDMMDNLRDGNLDDTNYLKICKKTILYNDIRFRIKNKINLLNNSNIKEEKGYSITIFTINIISYNHIEDLIEPILYVSLKYDKVIIKSSIDLNIIIDYFKYDKFVVFDNNINDSVTINNQLAIDDIYNI